MRLRTTQETGTLDACIERMISLSSSWKIRLEDDWCVLVCKTAVQLCSIYWRSYAVSQTRVRWGGSFRNFWVGICRWDPGTLWLYQSKFNWILPPYNRVNSPNPTYPGVALFQKLMRSLAQCSQNKTFYHNFSFSLSLSLSLKKKKKKRDLFFILIVSVFDFNPVPWFRRRLHPEQCQARMYALLRKINCLIFNQ